MHGKDARAVYIAGLLQAIERPKVVAPYRKTGGTVATNRCPRNIFEHGLGATDILSKLHRRLLSRMNMAVTVTGKLMSLGDNFLQQVSVPFGDPTEAKKRRFHLMHRKEFEDSTGIGVHSRFQILPIVTAYLFLERRYLKPFLDIGAHCIDWAYFGIIIN
jgi:hypothetical protein